MASDTWTSVDTYFAEMAVRPDPSYQALQDASIAAGLPDIAISAAEGKQLHLMAKMSGARRILEIGTLGGYSTIWMARALPAGGELITLEIDAMHAEVARKNVERAGVGDRVKVLVAPAAESLATLEADGVEPFDLVFIDADKASSAIYFQAALRLSRPGSLIIVDNVVRKGAVVDAATTDVNIRGIREVTELLARETRVSATAVQTVGSKGYDGFILARVVERG